MKLLQLNMWMGRLTRQIIPLIESEQPEIITAQEIFNGSKDVIFPDTTFDLVERIKLAGNFPYVCFSPTWDMDIMGTNAPFGNAIFSKYPITHQETLYTGMGVQHAITAQTYKENQRNAQFVKLQIDEHELLIVNHHAHWAIHPSGTAESVEKMRAVAKRLDSLLQKEIPVIIAGDMNVNPRTDTMRVLSENFEDLVESHGITNTLSPLGKVQNVACDHVLINSLVVPGSFRVLDDLVSDHLAVTLEFELQNHQPGQEG